MEVAPAGQRVLACIALCGRVANRSRIAAMLWPESSERRATANLRGAVYRLPGCIGHELQKDHKALGFSARWEVDLASVSHQAKQLRDGTPLDGLDNAVFADDLLPDWLEDDWLIVERERHRQLRLHALEDLAEAQLATGCPLDAVDTALQAVGTEPLRESAQLLLLRAHLAAGNRAAACRQFDAFERLLRVELRVEPSPRMCALITGAGIRRS